MATPSASGLAVAVPPPRPKPYQPMEAAAQRQREALRNHADLLAIWFDYAQRLGLGQQLAPPGWRITAEVQLSAGQNGRAYEVDPRAAGGEGPLSPALSDGSCSNSTVATGWSEQSGAPSVLTDSTNADTVLPVKK